jgi:hypothetical protein
MEEKLINRNKFRNNRIDKSSKQKCEVAILMCSVCSGRWTSWVLVAHACNPSYSGGRDQEDHGSASQGK